MVDMQSFWRDVQEFPLTYPLHRFYSWFMSIERGEHFPFYIYKPTRSVADFEGSVVKFLDYLVDAHELERNKADINRSFYQRSRYVAANFHRYSNDTMANLMFDTKLRQSEYDRLNNTIGQQTALFYASSCLTHLVALSYMAYFFRFRRLSKPQVLAVGSAYYYAYGNINNILYKLTVDQAVVRQARAIGQDHHVQPTGEFKPRGLNF